MIALTMLALTGWLGVVAQGEEKISFNQHVRPILAKHCFACHGFDEQAREGDLQLDDRAAAIDAGAIMPGAPEQSELIARVVTDDADSIMPPADSGDALTTQEIEILRRWIREGAGYQQHWAFQPSRRPSTSQAGANQSPHAIDWFVNERLKAAGLTANEPADRITQLRRVSLDLTGLPPTGKQIQAYLADDSEKSYERLVDELLASDAYGEHWARPWLDLARYADTKGYEKDRPRIIWRYRDWVIDALNQDMPFDQFTIEQLAGDLLADSTPDQILATAFHRNTMENDEGGTDDEEFRVAAVKDRVDTTIQVWMGLTMGCAKCHSHKYDPISQQDYYRLYAFFNQTEDADRQQPIVPTPTKQQQQQQQSLETELQTLQAELQRLPEGYTEAWQSWKKQFDDQPLWVALKGPQLESEQQLTLEQDAEGVLHVQQELPEKDTWSLTLALPADQEVTALRLETLPKPKSTKWQDPNVVINELQAELITPDGQSQRLKLVRPRADFSQRNWEVPKAIDGDPKTGWAFSPNAAKPHAAIFDFETAIKPTAGSQLRLKIVQQYGIGLVLRDFKVSVSSYASDWLLAEIHPQANLQRLFQRTVYEPTIKLHQRIESTRKQITALNQSIPKTPIMRELPETRRRETKIHVRGNFLDRGDVVSGAIPSAFGTLPAEAPQNRLGVAQWLVSPKNPLTARVAVNRVWAQLFGIGLVETEEDFGTQGTLPSHPKLLDWLAVEFRDNGWSQKQLLKTIVLSDTYRQSAVTSAAKIAADPRNRLYSRSPRFRLSAEEVRDQALAVSGLLTERLGGPSVMPPQPDGVWKSTYSGEQWRNATDDNRYRRGLYTYKNRTSPFPAMLTFDAGSGEVCQIRRIRTNTPLQALVTLNDTVYLEAAGALAKHMQAAGETPREQIAHGFSRVLIRPAQAIELDRLLMVYEQFADLYKDQPEQAKRFLMSAGLEDGDPRLVAVANVLLNLDETLTKP